MSSRNRLKNLRRSESESLQSELQDLHLETEDDEDDFLTKKEKKKAKKTKKNKREISPPKTPTVQIHTTKAARSGGSSPAEKSSTTTHVRTGKEPKRKLIRRDVQPMASDTKENHKTMLFVKLWRDINRRISSSHKTAGSSDGFASSSSSSSTQV